MDSSPLAIEYRAPGKLVPYARNSRTHTTEQIAKIAKSIREFGFLNPVLVDRNGGIVAGHARVLAAIAIGLEEVPTIALESLTPEQLRAYVIADNKLAELAGWDSFLLQTELLELRAGGYELEVLGFDPKELDDLLAPPTPPATFPEYGAGLETHYRCPRCHYEWSGKPHA